MLQKIAGNRWSSARVLTVLGTSYLTFWVLFCVYKAITLYRQSYPKDFEPRNILGIIELGAVVGAMAGVLYTATILVVLVLGFLLLRRLPLIPVLKTFLLAAIVTGISWLILRIILILSFSKEIEIIIVYSIIFAITATILWRSGWMNHNSAGIVKLQPRFLGTVFALAIFGGIQASIAFTIFSFFTNDFGKTYDSFYAAFPMLFFGYFPVGMTLGLSAALCGFVVWKIAAKQNWNQKRSCFTVALGMMFGTILAFTAARVWYLEWVKTVSKELPIDVWWLGILTSLIAGISGYFLCLGFPKTSPKPQEAAKNTEE